MPAKAAGPYSLRPNSPATARGMLAAPALNTSTNPGERTILSAPTCSRTARSVALLSRVENVKWRPSLVKRAKRAMCLPPSTSAATWSTSSQGICTKSSGLRAL